MNSIRFNLIATILAAMTLLIFLSALHGYNRSTQEAKVLLDRQLRDIAHILSLAEEGRPPRIADIGRVDTTTMAFQIWHRNTLVGRSTNMPTEAVVQFVPGFQNRNFNGYRWRCYVHRNRTADSWVITAERTDIRNQLIDNLIVVSAVPIIMILPAALVLIWYLTGLGLRPLKQLSSQLQEKQPGDLSHVRLAHTPAELRPLIDAINNLLTRLGDGFLREKRFSADAAHELRTPISALKISMHNLKKQAPDSIDFSPLEGGINRMGHVVEQILALYRINPDQYHAKFESIDVVAVAQSCVADNYAMFAAKQQQISLNGDSAILDGDRFTLETLFRNLLGNANKYTPEDGQIEITIDTDSRHVRVRIEDSGPGIPETLYQRVFDRFYRLDDAQDDTAIEGCGLGLSIVQHIVQLYDARLELSRSKFASGLAITIRFPRSTNRAEMTS